MSLLKAWGTLSCRRTGKDQRQDDSSRRWQAHRHCYCKSKICVHTHVVVEIESYTYIVIRSYPIPILLSLRSCPGVLFNILEPLTLSKSPCNKQYLSRLRLRRRNSNLTAFTYPVRSKHHLGRSQATPTFLDPASIANSTAFLHVYGTLFTPHFDNH